MRRIKLVIAYDGTNFHGWQYQPDARTVEGELNAALTGFLKTTIQVIGASRTDAGVHACGNVAIFDTESTVPGDRFGFAVNRNLPEDMKIVSSEEVAPDFHPRYDSHHKTYEYHIITGEIFPTDRLYAWYVWEELDVDKMNEAAAYLVGKHDFSSFRAAGCVAKDSIRTIFDANVRRDGRQVIISITGDGFLYNMVRIIAGTLRNVGAGRIAPEKMKDIIEAADRKEAGPTAPPQGLFLKEIVY